MIELSELMLFLSFGAAFRVFLLIPLSFKPPGSESGGLKAIWLTKIVFGYCLCIHSGTRRWIDRLIRGWIWPYSYITRGAGLD
ncbi:MAG: hypothetical protein OJF50_003437 [Nitrospira sp.]|jgi:hypothetical protein|nr:hypothetical protein [Nitrospira sp.]